MKPTFWREGGPTYFTRPSRHRPPPLYQAGGGRLAQASGVALAALLLGLSLGTTPLEIASGIALAVALVAWDRTPADLGELAAPALIVALGWLLWVLAPEGGLRPVERVWAIAPIWAVPILFRSAPDWPWVRIGVGGALAAAAVALAQVTHAVATDTLTQTTASGLVGHHLTLGYALLPPLAVAMHRRWHAAAVVLIAAALSTRALGVAISVGTLVVVQASVETWGRRAAWIGLAAPTCLVAVMAAAPSLAGQRAILWTAGALVAGEGGVGPGARPRLDVVHEQIDPSFFFPHHAHDNLVQLAVDAGPAAWIGVAWAAWVVWQSGRPWLIALGAAYAVGGLTQDLIGDLEVLRAAAVWAALGLAMDKETT